MRSSIIAFLVARVLAFAVLFFAGVPAFASGKGGADLNGDGKADVVWTNASTGQTSAWLMNGTTATSEVLLLTDPNWRVIGTPDLNGDGKADLLWYNASTGQTAAWLMNGTTAISEVVLAND